MAWRKVSSAYYMADSLADLADLPSNILMGTQCLVIEENGEFTVTSDGRWIRDSRGGGGHSTSSDDDYFPGESIDLSQYATKDFVRKLLANELKNYASADNLVFKMFNYDEIAQTAFGLSTSEEEGIGLIDKMKTAGLGMYNFYCGENSIDLPREVIIKGYAARGVCCVDMWKSEEEWSGWIILIDQSGEAYAQYINNTVASGWKKLSYIGDWMTSY